MKKETRGGQRKSAGRNNRSLSIINIMTAKEKALSLCQQFGETTLFDKDINDGKTLPLRVAKMCAMILVNELIEPTKETSFPMGGIDGKQYNYENFWLEVKEEIENL